jgi:UDP-N-acetylglucosamine 2-epimerase
MGGKKMKKKKSVDFSSPVEVSDWFSLRVRKKMSNGKNLLELMSYRESSLFWSIFPELVSKINGTLEIVRENKSYTKNKFASNFLNGASIISISILSKIINALQNRKRAKKKNKVLFFTFEKAWRTLPDKKARGKRRFDFQYESILKEISKNKYNTEAITIAPIWRADDLTSISELLGRFFYQKSPHIALEAFWAFNVFRKQRTARKGFVKAWGQLKKDECFKNTFLKENKLVGKAVKEACGFLFENHCLAIIKIVELTIKIIEKEKPGAIVVLNNGGWYWKAIMIAAKTKKIPVVSLQHAGIMKQNLNYFFDGTTGVLAPQMPDKFLAYGDWTKRMVSEVWKYKKGSVVVTGVYKYDELVEIKKKFNNEKFCKSKGIDSKKKIIFFAAQIPESPWIEKELPVLEQLKKFKDAIVLIKPHPRGDSQKYVEITKKIGLNAILLNENLQPYEAILASDLVVSLPSTIITEAAILGRPSVILNLNKEDIQIPWEKSGVSLVVSSKQEIYSTIKKALLSSGARSKMKMARKKFVYAHTFKQDGKASERVSKVIYKLFKEK